MPPEQQDPQEWQSIIERGARCALRDDNARWDWADLALTAAGTPGEDEAHNGSGAVLDALLGEVAAHANVCMSELPSLSSLRNYRVSADSLPPEHRVGVGVIAAQELRRHYPDRAARYAVVAELRAASSKGRVTVDDVRTRAGAKTTRPRPRSKEYSKFAVAMQAAYSCLHDAANLVADGPPLTDGDNHFAQNRLTQIHYELQRIRERLRESDTISDIDAEFAGLLGGTS
ncbi:MAG: hypothetical protein WKF96_08055 [Solirubrobacteraceae bacterium]